MVLAPQLRLGIFVSTNTEGGSKLSDALPARIVEHFYAPPSALLPPPGRPDLTKLASVYDGQYLVTRRRHSGLEGFLGRFQASPVSVTSDRLLEALGRRYLPTDQADEFQPTDAPVGALQGLSFVRDGNRATRMQSFVIAFERVGPIFQVQTLAVTAGLAVLAALGTLAGLRIRFRRGLPQTPVQRIAAWLPGSNRPRLDRERGGGGRVRGRRRERCCHRGVRQLATPVASALLDGRAGRDRAGGRSPSCSCRPSGAVARKHPDGRRARDASLHARDGDVCDSGWTPGAVGRAAAVEPVMMAFARVWNMRWPPMDDLAKQYALVLLSRRSLRALAAATFMSAALLFGMALVLPLALAVIDRGGTGKLRALPLAALLACRRSVALAVALTIAYVRIARRVGRRIAARRHACCWRVSPAPRRWRSASSTSTRALGPDARGPLRVHRPRRADRFTSAMAAALVLGPMELRRSAPRGVRAVLGEARVGTGTIAEIARLLDLPDIRAFRTKGRRGAPGRSWCCRSCSRAFAFYWLMEWPDDAAPGRRSARCRPTCRLRVGRGDRRRRPMRLVIAALSRQLH